MALPAAASPHDPHECKRRQTCHYRLKGETEAKERRGSTAGRRMAARV